MLQRIVFAVLNISRSNLWIFELVSNPFELTFLNSVPSAILCRLNHSDSLNQERFDSIRFQKEHQATHNVEVLAMTRLSAKFKFSERTQRYQKQWMERDTARKVIMDGAVWVMQDFTPFHSCSWDGRWDIEMADHVFLKIICDTVHSLAPDVIYEILKTFWKQSDLVSVFLEHPGMESIHSIELSVLTNPILPRGSLMNSIFRHPHRCTFEIHLFLSSVSLDIQKTVVFLRFQFHDYKRTSDTTPT